MVRSHEEGKAGFMDGREEGRMGGRTEGQEGGKEKILLSSMVP